MKQKRNPRKSQQLPIQYNIRKYTSNNPFSFTSGDAKKKTYGSLLKRGIYYFKNKPFFISSQIPIIAQQWQSVFSICNVAASLCLHLFAFDSALSLYSTAKSRKKKSISVPIAYILIYMYMYSRTSYYLIFVIRLVSTNIERAHRISHNNMVHGTQNPTSNHPPTTPPYSNVSLQSHTIAVHADIAALRREENFFSTMLGPYKRDEDSISPTQPFSGKIPPPTAKKCESHTYRSQEQSWLSLIRILQQSG